MPLLWEIMTATICEDHFNLPNEMAVAEDGTEGGEAELTQVKTSFRGQNNGTSQSHGNYIQATEDEMDNQSASNGVKPNQEGKYDFTERREMETKGNYYYLYDNVLFVTLNTGAYPGGNDEENAGNAAVPSANAENEAEGIVENFRKTLDAATSEYQGQYQWLIVTHHKSTQTVAKHAADSDVENYVDAGFESLMTEFDVDFVLGGHDHVYSRSYVLKASAMPSGWINTMIRMAPSTLPATAPAICSIIRPLILWIKQIMPTIRCWQGWMKTATI